MCSLALGSSSVSSDQLIRVEMSRRNTAVVMINMRREVLTMLKSWEKRELIYHWRSLASRIPGLGVHRLAVEDSREENGLLRYGWVSCLKIEVRLK